MGSFQSGEDFNGVCREGHRYYIFDRAITANNIFHSFAICTRCGKDWYKARDLGADILWCDGSHAESTSKEF